MKEKANTITSENLARTQFLAANFVRSLAPARTAVVVALYGDLGSGKTTFAKAAAAALGITEIVNSPTFVIQKKYSLPASSKNFTSFIHIDAYRLNSADELARLDWAELMKDPHNLIFIEWPERVSALIPAAARKIHFAFINETSREVMFEE